MKGLKCTTTNCEHNHGCHCDAGVINIDKKGCCRTKIKRELGALGQAFEAAAEGFEAAQDFDYARNEEVLIQCDSVHCAYNAQNVCNSSLVNIGNGFFKTKCFTKHINPQEKG